MALAAGTHLGPYEIVAKIGAGGMGEVYRAHDSRLNRRVAIKILPEGFAADGERVRRFELEAQAAGSLNHPNIVSIFDFGQVDHTIYAVTELLEGETLRARLSGAALPARKAIEYTIQIARGLAAAHAKGITHRDIKPENLFVTSEGFIKILDFGLAKMTKPEASSATNAPTAPIDTEPGIAMGTAGYMSPEQVRGMGVDHRTDLFSLGVVMYEMLSGHRAFTGQSSIETMNAILTAEPPELPETLSPAIIRIVRRCLEKKPDERFESARDLAFALESIAGATGRETSLGLAAQARRRPMGIWVIAATAALALALAAVSFLGGARWARHEPATFQRLTFRRGAITNAVFSNDGKTVVYDAQWDGKTRELFLTQPESPESRNLGLPDARVGAISKSGEMALVLRVLPGTLARVPLAGGAPREVSDGVQAVDWAPNGTDLAVVRILSGGESLEYPLGKKIYETAGDIATPKVSPDGQLVAFADKPIFGDNGGHVTVVDRLGKRRTLTQWWPSIDGLAWSPDGSEVWFSAMERGGSSTLYAATLKGSQRLLMRLPGGFSLTDIAADGRALLVQSSTSQSMFYQKKGAEEPVDLYWHDGSNVRDLSVSTNEILFSETGGAAASDSITYLRKADDSAVVRLGEGLATAFSPNGLWAMLNPNAKRPAQLLAVPRRAGEPHALTSDDINHIAGRWLPDSKGIVFVGAEPNHRNRYYKQAGPSAKPVALSSENIEFDRDDDIVISPDGKTVAGSVTDEGIHLFSVEGKPEGRVPGLDGSYTPLAWCTNGSLLFYQSYKIPAHVMRVDPETGKQSEWRDIAPAARTGLTFLTPIRIASDCETFAYTASYEFSTVFLISGLR